MKRRVLYIALAAEVVFLCIIYLLADFSVPLVSSVMAVPFEQIGILLRVLSLKGGILNGIALMLWAGICLLPLLAVTKDWQDRAKRAEHIALGILSVVLFVGLYYMVNPGLLFERIPTVLTETILVGTEEMAGVLKASVSMMIWSVAVCYGVFVLLRLFRAGEKEQLFLYIRRLLYVLCGLFAGTMALTALEAVTGIRTAQSGLDGVFNGVKALIAALPYAMDIVVTLFALTVLDALLEDSRSEEVVVAAKRLSGICCITLAVVTSAGAALNIIQWLLSKKISNINVHVSIPFMSLAFVLAALLFSRLLEENKQLADENEMFV
jgi:hypothetical protein